jgi:hypothetical protein
MLWTFLNLEIFQFHSSEMVFKNIKETVINVDEEIIQAYVRTTQLFLIYIFQIPLKKISGI